MIIRENVALREYNTFGVNSTAKKLIEFDNKQEIISFFENQKSNSEKYLVLGSGSNILFTSDFDGNIIRNLSHDFSIIKENLDHVWIKGDAGIIWNQFVLHTLNMGYQGLENLTLIPGTLGAAPIQNIGAYGVELENYVESVEFFDFKAGIIRTLNNKECNFSYRNSIFKQELKGRTFILNLYFRLNKTPQFNISYKDIQKKLSERSIKEITALAISSVVTEIRQSKLPDPLITGNAGSIFKNPVITIRDYNKIKSEFEKIPVYPVKNNKVKVPAAWLIEQCGWKGVQKGNVAVSTNHSLIIINLGQASGSEIYRFAQDIKSSVLKKFKIDLELELNIV